MSGFEDLSYKEYSFKLTIGVGEIEELISPEIEGIGEDEWLAMPRPERRKWLYRASKEWAAEYIEVSWN